MPVIDLKKGLWAIFALCLSPALGGAIPIDSQGSGPWSQTGSWNPAQVPTAADTVTILAGHTITVDITTAMASTTTIQGTLSFSRVASSSLTIVGGNMTVARDGLLDLGTEPSPIPSSVFAHLVLAHGTSPGEYGLIISTGGNFSLRGSTKTPTAVAIPGDDLLTSEDRATLPADPQTVYGWQAGDLVTISPTEFSGPTSTELRVIAGFPGSNQIQVQSNFSTIHYGTGTIHIANLTRNVVVRSSGTAVTGSGNSAYLRSLSQSATSFAVSYGEFIFLGASAGGNRRSVTMDGPSVKARISSSTFRSGYNGLYLNGASGIILESNIFHSNNQNGLLVHSADANEIVRNHFSENLGDGVYLENHDRNFVAFNEAYSNSGSGIFSLTIGHNVNYSNRAYSNSAYGLTPGTGDLTVDNQTYLNIHGLAVFSPTQVLKHHSYRNSGFGLFANGIGSDFVLLAEGALGYRPDGSPISNGSEIGYQASQQERSVLRGVRINPQNGISTTGLNIAGNYILSYNQDADTGTVRLWGDYDVVGATLTLDYAQRLSSAAGTLPILIRGSGHAITAVVPSDAAALTELIQVTALGGGNWRVEGSSSGVLNASFNCPSGSCSFTHAKVNFTLAPGTIVVEDRLAFATIAASQDQNRQKKFLFGPTAPNLNRGRSRLAAAPSAGLVFQGVSGSPTIIDRFSSGSTYYTLIDSGALTLSFVTVLNADELGLQLSGTAGVAISSAVFDFAGQGNSSTSAYVTARALTSATTLNGVTFGNGRPNSVLRNIRVAGTDAGLNWTVAAWQGAASGPTFEDDPNNRVQWEDGVATISVAAVNLSSITVSWLSVGATSYALKASTASNITGTVFLSSTASQVTSLTVNNLAFNTTYFLRLDTGIPSGSTTSAVITGVTLSTAPEPVSFSGITAAGFTVNWPANNPAGTRYEISVSTSIDFSGASVQSLTATSQAFGGLINNTAYFTRVRAINHSGTASAYALGAVVTAAGVITISANRLPAFWYGSPSTVFNAQGANSYRWRITSNPTESPILADPDFNGSAQFFTVPEGVMYFHVLGVGGVGDGQVAHFGPVQIDLTAPTMAPLSAQISGSDTGPILDGGLTTGSTPRVSWSEPASASPVVGYSISLSTNAADQPGQIVGTTLRFSDQTLNLAGVNYAKVRAVDLAGNWGSAAGISFTFTITPTSSGLTLRQNYFNPLRGECVRLEVRAPSSSRLLAEIYNALEQKVATMSDQVVPVGIYTLAWCGRNANNQVVATGAYLLRVEAPEHKKNYKVIVVK